MEYFLQKRVRFAVSANKIFEEFPPFRLLLQEDAPGLTEVHSQEDGLQTH